MIRSDNFARSKVIVEIVEIESHGESDSHESSSSCSDESSSEEILELLSILPHNFLLNRSVR